MASVLDSVNQRTQLVGQNRLELLLFHLGGRQLYGINVFKVKEVLTCPALNAVPGRSATVRGVAHIRGGTIPVIDLRLAIGGKPLEDPASCFVIITEYNRTQQGFLVRGVDRIVNLNWSEVHPPPSGSGKSHYLTAVTQVGEQLVEIIDVEKVLSEVVPMAHAVSEGVVKEVAASSVAQRHVLIVDDSTIARKQIKKVMESIGVESVLKIDGREALDYLRGMLASGRSPQDELVLIISDIEMPEMDGYTFTAELRNDPQLKDLHIILHTSLSGVFNAAMVQKVGADDFLAKFHPDELARRVNERILALSGDKNLADEH